MIVKQVSVFLENKSGRLNEVTQILGNEGINISAFSVADTSDFGVLRMIVSEPEKAFEVLKQNHFSAKITDVVRMNTPNVPGALAKALKILSSEDVFIEYIYAFSMDSSTAVIVIRPNNVAKCVEVLENHKSELLSQDKNYQL